MIRNIAALLATWFCLMANSHAQGTIQNITFDGPPLIAPGAGTVVTNYFESGMSFRPMPGSYGFARYGPGYPSDPQDGTDFLKAALGTSLMCSFTSGSPFGLVSVDLAEYSTVVPNAVTVHFVGYREDGSIVSTDFTTDGIIDGTGPLQDFQTFDFSKEWTDLERVEIPTWGWSLDNLVVSVPEPGSCALLMLGIAFLAATRPRKRS